MAISAAIYNIMILGSLSLLLSVLLQGGAAVGQGMKEWQGHYNFFYHNAKPDS